MYEHFDNLTAENKERILDACTEEFAARGYVRASTNAMVKRAGIPKGTLFYFFGSKKNLYLYILDHAVAMYAELSRQEGGELPGDLFERLARMHELRMRFALQQPLLFRLFYDAFIQAPDEIRAELEGRFAGYAAGSQERITAGLDRSKFREGVDADKAVRMISLLLEGLLNSHMAELMAAPPGAALELVNRLAQECEGYFEMMRRGIYQP